MFERFTDAARRAVVEAKAVSDEMNHDHIETGHLLVGILRNSESRATKLLYALGVSLEVVLLHLADYIVGVAAGATPPKHVPFTPRTAKALELALREALSLNVNYIDTEHILFGMLRDKDSVASMVLKKLDVDYNRAILEYVNPTQPNQSVTTGDGRVRVTQVGSVVTVTINADAWIQMKGLELESEPRLLRSIDEHVISIDLADPQDSKKTDAELIKQFTSNSRHTA